MNVEGVGAAAAAGGGTAGGRATSTTRAGTRALVLNATILGVVGSRGDSGIGGGVHTHGDPGEDTVGDRVAEVDVLHDGVDGVSLLGEDGVFGVGGQLLGVGAIGGSLLDLGDEILVEEDLADMGGGRGVEAGDGTVSLDDGLVDGVSQDCFQMFSYLDLKLGLREKEKLYSWGGGGVHLPWMWVARLV